MYVRRAKATSSDVRAMRRQSTRASSRRKTGWRSESAWKRSLSRRKSRVADSATTVAERGSPVTSAISPEAVAGPEDGEPLARAVALAADLDGAAHDHVERVAGVALGEDGLAGRELDLVELADQAGEDLAREVGEQRHGPKRGDDRVHRGLVGAR